MSPPEITSVGGSTPNLRQAARALVLDPDDAVLLVCFPTDAGDYWATPGGGLEPGETMREGLRRELAEELGQPDLEIGPLLWTRTSWFQVSDAYDGQYNEIYLVRAPHFEPNPQIGWDGMRAEGVSEMRWWTLDQIEAGGPDAIFVPADLAALTRELLRDGPPDRARSLNATSFGGATDSYDRGRPEYPPEAVQWMTAFVPAASRIADVGAGTGKLARALVALGFETIAVDPDPEMLDALGANLPGTSTLIGSAEAVPLPVGAVAAATFGQSWHWVDVSEASTEMGRIIAPGGTLGLIWNIRDTGVDWVAAMTEIIRVSSAERMVMSESVEVAGPFGPPETASFPWSRPMDRGAIEAMVRSRSDYLAANPGNRARIDRGLAELLDRIGLVGNEVIDFPYVTYVHRSVRDG